MNVTTTSLLLSALLGGARAAPGWPDLSGPVAASPGEGAKDGALVIAVEDYAFAPDLPGAVANGQDWVRWLREVRGVALVKTLVNAQASREEILAAAEGLAARVGPGGRTWVIFIGHGAPARSGEDGVLVGVDAQQTALSLEARSVSRSELVDRLTTGSAAEVVLVLDASFSGKTSGGDLAPGLAPLKPVQARLGGKATILAAAATDEVAGQRADGRRPAFSYLALGALRGWADADGDGRVHASEVVTYTGDALFRTLDGRRQTPILDGPDLDLAASGGEAGPALDLLAGAASAVPTATGPSLSSLRDQLALAEQQQAQALQAAQSARAAILAQLQAHLDAAEGAVHEQAQVDFQVVAPLLASPTEAARPALEAFVSRFAHASIEVEGERREVDVAEVAQVQAALARLDDASRAPRQVPAPQTSSSYAMVEIPRGSTERPGRGAAGRVEVERALLVGSTEVTQALWASVMFSNPAAYPDCGPQCPVESVSWVEAATFANALSVRDGLVACYRIDGDDVRWLEGLDCTGYRLPTEAEWEYAARAGTEHSLAGGDDADEVAWYAANSGARPHPVGGKAPNAWGLHDMTGNVWEWTWDGRGPLEAGPGAPDLEAEAWQRTGRGGGWINGKGSLTLDTRNFADRTARLDAVGLRLVRSAPVP